MGNNFNIENVLASLYIFYVIFFVEEFIELNTLCSRTPIHLFLSC